MKYWRRFKKRTIQAGVVLWFGVTALIVGTLMVPHLVSLPEASLNQLTLFGKKMATSGRWTLVHLLGSDCDCSQEVAHRLKQRLPIQDGVERVVIFGKRNMWASELSSRGYQVEQGSAEDFVSQFGIQGVPQLLIYSPSGSVSYAGGYRARPGRSGDIQDMALYEKAKKLDPGRRLAALPIFGCANGRKMKKQLDPLGVKYE